MKSNTKNILWWYAFLLVAAAYAAGLLIDLTGDGGLYAAITRQMVESGNWLNLQINGEPYDQKPHLLFWLAGIGVRLFGNTNFAFKIFPVLYGWLGFWFIYRLGKTVYSAQAGKLAALFAATSQVFFLYSFDIHTDIVLQTGVVLALWQLAEYLKFQRPLNFILGFLGIGLAMLAKGPVGAVLPFFAVLLYLLAEKNYKQLVHPKWIIGVLIALLVNSPTLIHLFKNFGWQGIGFYFITNNFGRISGEYAGSSSDPFFYFYNAIWMFLPWTIVVFYAGYKEITSWFLKKEKDTWGIALLGSVLILTTVLSIAKGKAPNYFLIAVPPVFVLSAKWVNIWYPRFSEKKPRLLKLQWILLGVLILFLLFAAVFYRDVSLTCFIPAAVVSLTAAFFSVKTFKKPIVKVACISVIFIGLFNFYLNTSFVPQLAKYQGARQALEIFDAQKEPGDKLYCWDLEEYELYFMAEKQVENIDSWEKMFEIMKKHETWLYTNKTKCSEIQGLNYEIDTIYNISYRGLNEINFHFLSPASNPKNFKDNCLIKVK